MTGLARLGAALIAGLAPASLSAQMAPPCCHEPGAGPTPYLVGRVSADGRTFALATGEKVQLMVTQQQAAEVPSRVDLSSYRSRVVILLCQPWFPSSDTAWGCEAIGRLVETRGIRTRPR